MSDERRKKVAANLQKSIADGDFYEAHQRCRTLVARMVSKKEYTAAFELLTKISKTLNQHEQRASAADLAIYYLDIYKKSQLNNVDEHIDAFVEFHENIPQAVENAKSNC